MAVVGLHLTCPVIWTPLYRIPVNFSPALHPLMLRYVHLFYSSPSSLGWMELNRWLNSCTECLMSLHRHGDFSVFPILMQISFGTSQRGISTGHVGQEALPTVLLCLCFWLFLTVYLLSHSGLCWFECLHCLDTLPAAAASLCGASGPS